MTKIKWIGHSEWSVEKDNNKRALIYYAYPEGERYGYFTSTTKQAYDTFLEKMNGR